MKYSKEFILWLFANYYYTVNTGLFYNKTYINYNTYTWDQLYEKFKML